jgi:hypothetical protein
MDATDAERYLALNASDLESSPEAVFERQWALRLTERALDRLKRDYVEREQEPLFEQLCPLLTSEAPHQNRSSGTDMGNDAFRTALSRARRRFGEALRAEIRETVSNPEEVEDELRHLLRVLTA